VQNKLLIKYLVEEYGADINKENSEGETPLLRACTNRKRLIIKYKIERRKKFEINKTSLVNNNREKHIYIVKYYIGHGADINKENMHGCLKFFNIF